MFYYPHDACRNGHEPKRYTSTTHCVEYHRLRADPRHEGASYKVRSENAVSYRRQRQYKGGNSRPALFRI
jgi:hypothetical protein